MEKEGGESRGEEKASFIGRMRSFKKGTGKASAQSKESLLGGRSGKEAKSGKVQVTTP